MNNSDGEPEDAGLCASNLTSPQITSFEPFTFFLLHWLSSSHRPSPESELITYHLGLTWCLHHALILVL